MTIETNVQTAFFISYNAKFYLNPLNIYVHYKAIMIYIRDF